MRSFESLVAEALSAPFEGWDFTWLDGRTATEALPWSYVDVVDSYAATSQRMLDMGTGGGEVLSRLRRAPVTVATEAWGPNAPIAARRLGPLGVSVVRDEGAPDNSMQDGTRGRLPFRSGSFDLITNRHEAFRASEATRVLAEGGMFVTQQVDYHSYDDFLSAFGGTGPRSAGQLAPAGSGPARGGGPPSSPGSGRQRGAALRRCRCGRLLPEGGGWRCERFRTGRRHRRRNSRARAARPPRTTAARPFASAQQEVPPGGHSRGCLKLWPLSSYEGRTSLHSLAASSRGPPRSR